MFLQILAEIWEMLNPDASGFALALEPMTTYILSTLGASAIGGIWQSIENERARKLREKQYDAAEAEYAELLPMMRGRLTRLFEEQKKGEAAGLGRRGLATSGMARGARRASEARAAEGIATYEGGLRERIAGRLADIKLGRAQEIVPGTFGSELAGMGGTLLAGGPEYMKYLFPGRPKPKVGPAEDITGLEYMG